MIGKGCCNKIIIDNKFYDVDAIKVEKCLRYKISNNIISIQKKEKNSNMRKYLQHRSVDNNNAVVVDDVDDDVNDVDEV